MTNTAASEYLTMTNPKLERVTDVAVSEYLAMTSIVSVSPSRVTEFLTLSVFSYLRVFELLTIVMSQTDNCHVSDRQLSCVRQTSLLHTSLFLSCNRIHHERFAAGHDESVIHLTEQFIPWSVAGQWNNNSRTKFYNLINTT